MKLSHGIHLGYCTNIHRGESWQETFAGLEEYTLRVKERVSPDAPYAIGLRLSHQAALELRKPEPLAAFRDWLAEHDCYLFSINGFPYGKFHGTRVKEQVYVPDWSTTERLEYTNLLFDLLVELLPAEAEGSVSTLPGSFKEFVEDYSQVDGMCDRLLACEQHIEELRQRTGRDLHLGLEPEPLGLFETSGETVEFFERLTSRAVDQGVDADRVLRNIGVNYATCHLAVEFEEAQEALTKIRGAGIRISKLHLSSALRLKPTPEALEKLRAFEEGVYLHQVVVKGATPAKLLRYRDLAPALETAADTPEAMGDEWRVHFHVPLHAQPSEPFFDTRDHLLGALDVLASDPGICRHLEMETYTWEVLPEAMRSTDVVEQLVKEYLWTLGELKARELT